MMETSTRPRGRISNDDVLAMQDRVVAIRIAMSDDLKAEVAALKSEREKWEKERAAFEKRKDIAKTLEAAEKVVADAEGEAERVRSESRDFLTQLERRDAELTAKGNELADREADIDRRVAEFAASQKKADADASHARQADIERHDALNAREADIEARAAAVTEREAKLSAREKSLNERLDALKIKDI